MGKYVFLFTIMALILFAFAVATLSALTACSSHIPLEARVIIDYPV